MVNTAIHLRRPLLVSGPPGCGKSTLALSIAYELQLGEVLYWPITSRTTVQDGLYRYDAVGRLHAAGLQERTRRPGRSGAPIGKYLSLGPLGTALLPGSRPRVLLVDEFDKGDIDLANDLLTVFEEGRFAIPELQRLSTRTVTVRTDDGQSADIERGAVECAQFPIVVITSNGERQFPPAFLRRCVSLRIPPPSRTKLRRIVEAHLGSELLADPVVNDLVGDFAEALKKKDGTYATDQLLNLLSLRTGVKKTDEDWTILADRLLGPLDDQP
ncbi:MoxR family ATPase [Actinoplanes hulinensis]|uniref:MoxR family ATPase n=1 Tax=Actinoplanes hulinensis TaxID=1144547 RepID=A0ABS7B821_9ACTN|nr:MoxR family ATPase [Actinoplanes hulinensis]